VTVAAAISFKFFSRFQEKSGDFEFFCELIYRIFSGFCLL